MKYIITYEIPTGNYDRDYMIHAICGKEEVAERKVAAFKKKIEKTFKNYPTILRSRLQSIKITPWDGKTPIALFSFNY